MHDASISANNRYILKVLRDRFGSDLSDKKILDFGCGPGTLVEFLRGHGLNAVGADPYPVRYGGWVQEKDHLHRIEDGHVPFDDTSFDIVVSNQVFEHIDDYTSELEEITRVLRPDGLFLALFPTLETIYEVHSGVYGAYYLKRWPGLLHAYLRVMHAFGFGLWRNNRTNVEWADVMRDIITRECHYKPQSRIKADWRHTFGTEPETMQADYLRFRIPAAKRLPDWLVGLLTTLRAGIVISITK